MVNELAARATPKLGQVTLPPTSTEDINSSTSEIDVPDSGVHDQEEESSFLGLTEDLSTNKIDKNRSTSPIMNTIKDKGILIHGLQQLFESIEEREHSEKRIFIVKCSYFEIYNDQVYDLLNEDFATTHESLQVVEDPKVSLFKFHIYYYYCFYFTDYPVFYFVHSWMNMIYEDYDDNLLIYV